MPPPQCSENGAAEPHTSARSIRSRVDRRGHAAEQRHRAGAAGGAALEKSRRDAENLGDFFGPERLRIGGRNRDAETLALKIFQAQARVFQREAHRPGNIFGARFARLAGFRSQTIRRCFADADDGGFVANAHSELARNIGQTRSFISRIKISALLDRNLKLPIRLLAKGIESAFQRLQARMMRRCGKRFHRMQIFMVSLLFSLLLLPGLVPRRKNLFMLTPRSARSTRLSGSSRMPASLSRKGWRPSWFTSRAPATVAQATLAGEIVISPRQRPGDRRCGSARRRSRRHGRRHQRRGVLHHGHAGD